MVAREIGFLDAEAPRIDFGRSLDKEEFERFLAYVSENTGYTIAGLERGFFLSRAGQAKSGLLRARYAVVDEPNKRKVLLSPTLRRNDERTLVTGVCFYIKPGYDAEDSFSDNPLTFLGLHGDYNRDPRDPLRIAERIEFQAAQYPFTRTAAS